jgi:hypothetical protein
MLQISEFYITVRQPNFTHYSWIYSAPHKSLSMQSKHTNILSWITVTSFPCCALNLCVLLPFLTTLAHGRMECIMLGEKQKFAHVDVSEGVEHGAEAINSKVYKETMIGGVDGQGHGFIARAQTLVLLTLSLQNTVETSRSSLHQNCNQIHTHKVPHRNNTIFTSHMTGFKYLSFLLVLPTTYSWSWLINYRTK